MKTQSSRSAFVLTLTALVFLGCLGASCSRNSDIDIALKDHGPEPTALNIDAHTAANENFITVFWTGKNLQVTLMSIPAGGEIGLERHADTDQFLRVEEGQAKVVMGDSKESLTFVRTVKSDFAIMIPAGKWHNVINTGGKPLKLYSVYAPPEHPRGAAYKTRKEAEAAHQH